MTELFFCSMISQQTEAFVGSIIISNTRLNMVLMSREVHCICAGVLMLVQ